MVTLPPALLIVLVTWQSQGLTETQPPVQAVQKGPGGLPITGKGPEILDRLDEGLEKIMLRHGVPGLAVALTKDGRLVYAKGIGWSHYETNKVATPETLFGLASVSKVLTALAIFKLVEEGKLKLDDQAFSFFKALQPPARSRVDPRLATITLRQLLNHSGGWDRTKSGDPINWSLQVSQRLGVPMPISEEHLVRYMLGVRLDFDPGSRSEYSNIGYILLGQIVARVSGQTYEDFVRTRVLKPLEMNSTRLHDRDGKYFPNEARRYNPGLLQAMPPYYMPWTDASGGWASTAVDLARLMTGLEGSRTGKPFLRADLMKEMTAPPPPPLQARPDGFYFGLGWDSMKLTPQGPAYFKSGCWPGVRAQVKHRNDGVNSVLLYNAIAQLDPVDMKIASQVVADIQAHLATVKEWPKIDLFEEFP